MQEESILDKKIINLTNDGARFYSSTKNDFYIDILEPIKNVTHIKLLKTSIRPNLTSINGTPIVDNDPIYISLNDYDRISTVKIVDDKATIYKSFEILNLNLTNKYLTMANSQIDTLITTNGLLFENIYTSTTTDLNDTSVYNIIPHEPSLLRFNIKIYDKDHELINIEDIKNFEMLICVFSNNKKVTMR